MKKPKTLTKEARLTGERRGRKWVKRIQADRSRMTTRATLMMCIATTCYRAYCAVSACNLSLSPAHDLEKLSIWKVLLRKRTDNENWVKLDTVRKQNSMRRQRNTAMKWELGVKAMSQKAILSKKNLILILTAYDLYALIMNISSILCSLLLYCMSKSFHVRACVNIYQTSRIAFEPSLNLDSEHPEKKFCCQSINYTFTDFGMQGINTDGSNLFGIGT